MKCGRLSAMLISGLVGCGYAFGQDLAAQAAVDVEAGGWNAASLRAVGVGQRVRVEGLRVAADVGEDAASESVDLELTRFDVLTPDAEVWVGGAEGARRAERPDVSLLAGLVMGEAGTYAFLAVSPYGTHGFIERGGELVSISTGAFDRDRDLGEAVRAVRAAALDGGGVGGQAPLCGVVPGDGVFDLVDGVDLAGPLIGPFTGPSDGVAGRGSVCRRVRVAIETDYEFTQRLFGGDTDAAAAYALTLMGAVSEIYRRDVDTPIVVPFLRVWESDDDPYTSEGDPLNEVQTHWNAEMDSVSRNLVHYLTGKSNMPYGGVAYLPAMCSREFGYGVSGYLTGFFPYPFQDHNSNNWDPTVVAHELGHNLGTGHTHDAYTPTIDDCGNGNCAGAFGGTIMSYCHTCAGGMNNISLRLHPRVQDRVRGYLAGLPCNISGPAVDGVDDRASTFEESGPIVLDVLANDLISSCEVVSFLSVPQQTVGGGMVRVLEGAGVDGRDLLEYTPAAGFSGSDSLLYVIQGPSGSLGSATVSIDVEALKPAVAPVSPVAGLRARYYALPPLSALPDFDVLTPTSESVSASIAYPSTGGFFAESGRFDDVGAVFDGYVNVVADGMHTFTTESDDGSKLYLDGELVVNNDGLHGMVERSGSVALEAGWHRVRIEFFERGGGAGLNATVAGPQLSRTVFSGSLIAHESGQACSLADVNADGVLNGADFNAWLAAFAAGDAVADQNSDGELNGADFNAWLANFTAGCP